MLALIDNRKLGSAARFPGTSGTEDRVRAAYICHSLRGGLVLSPHCPSPSP